MLEEIINIVHVLETERTILKRYAAGDGRAFFDLIEKNRDRMTDSFPTIVSYTNDQYSAEYFIRKKIEEWDEQSAYNFGIRLKENDQLIGHISVKNIDWFIPRGEIAYLISGKFEGRGFMTEALSAVIKFCFETLNMNKLFLRVLTANKRSCKLAERCGFTREGILRNDHKTFDGLIVDLYYYGMTREDYNKANNS